MEVYVTTVIVVLNEKIRLLKKKNISFVSLLVKDILLVTSLDCMNYPMCFNFWNLLINLPDEKQDKLKKLHVDFAQ